MNKRIEKPFPDISMEEWKKLMGYNKLWYKIRKVFFAIVKPHRKGKI